MLRNILTLLLTFLAATQAYAQIPKDTLLEEKEIDRPVVKVAGQMEPDSTLIEVAEPLFKIGGALRFNYYVKDWVESNKKKGGDFDYDLFRINVLGEYRRMILALEYRFYSNSFGGGMLKNGWLGYDISPRDEIHVGLHQVPFGNQVYNSDNWFFNLTYYLGFEDDYDIGLKYIHTGEKMRYVLAFYKNSEYPPGNFSRYSYDIVGINEETNQFNTKISYTPKNTRIGISAQYGSLYNHLTREMGSHSAFAVHMRGDYKPWTIKLQALTYGIDPANPDSIDDENVSMAAYNAAYNVSSTGQVYTISVAYGLDVEWGPVSNLKFYDNYSYFHKTVEDYYDSQMNVLGVMVTTGKIYTYIDFASGINHPWLGPGYTNSLAGGMADAPWHHRFNINVGYYF